ncbi:MAG TPA: hypothetical protein DEF42_10290 [Desulfosporosinus sp.]|nr:hypothetical protein [Desulfosporosinus sp.]
MSRKVYITSGMSIDERLLDVAEQDQVAALIWPWILTTFDDWGRAEAKSRKLKMKIFPGNEIVSADSIDAALRLYHEHGLIQLYEVDGRPYMAIPHEKWFKYQTHIRKTKREVDESKYPAPPIALVNAQVRDKSRENTPSPSPSTLPPFTFCSNNNNNNAREENEQTVNESVESDTNPDEIANDLPETPNDLDETFSKVVDVERPKDLGTRAVNWAEKNWGIPIPEGTANNILAWCDEFLTRGSTEPDFVVIEALKRCLDANVKNMNYLRAVLTDWRDNGILTVSQVEAREIERKKQKGHKRNNKDPGDKPPEPPKPGKYDGFYL